MCFVFLLRPFRCLCIHVVYTVLHIALFTPLKVHGMHYECLPFIVNEECVRGNVQSDSGYKRWFRLNAKIVVKTTIPLGFE